MESHAFFVAIMQRLVSILELDAPSAAVTDSKQDDAVMSSSPAIAKAKTIELMCYGIGPFSSSLAVIITHSCGYL